MHRISIDKYQGKVQANRKTLVFLHMRETNKNFHKRGVKTLSLLYHNQRGNIQMTRGPSAPSPTFYRKGGSNSAQMPPCGYMWKISSSGSGKSPELQIKQ